MPQDVLAKSLLYSGLCVVLFVAQCKIPVVLYILFYIYLHRLCAFWLKLAQAVSIFTSE